jgi:acyl phosphate:glycerol-3-phosphate acyltransferase
MPLALSSAILIFAAYLIGSLSFAVLVSRVSGLPDPRSYGSGNPGATNVLRTGNKAAAAATLVGDACKGWLALSLALYFAPRLGLGEATIACALLAVFLGHLYPLFFGFKGGKGVATALGILLALSIYLGLAVAAIWIVVFALFRLSSLAALVSALAAPALAVWLLDSRAVEGSIVMLAALLIWRHKSNIENLLTGRERRVG